MGIILARFRKKETTLEALEKLDNKIKAIEEFGKNTELAQKKIAGRFILFSVIAYVVTVSLYYFYFFPASLYEQVFYVIPLILTPVLLIGVKRTLAWWYGRKLRKNCDKLSKLKEEKKSILENVMEKETYKVAKKILEKFAPEEVVKKPTVLPATPSNQMLSLRYRPEATSDLRYRGNLENRRSDLFKTQTSFKGFTSTPQPPTPLVRRPETSLLTRLSQSQALVPTTTMPRTILPPDRTVLDKMVDYLVGDGPSNRDALICKHCFRHNGMAVKEETDYLSYYCCYCNAFNPSRKQRPSAPKIQFDLKEPLASQSSDTSESEKQSQTDSDSEAELNDFVDSSRTEVNSSTTNGTVKNENSKSFPSQIEHGETEKEPGCEAEDVCAVVDRTMDFVESVPSEGSSATEISSVADVPESK